MDNTTMRLVVLGGGGGEIQNFCCRKSLTQEKKGAICLV